MKKIIIGISIIALFFIIGLVFVGKTDNRFIFTLKEKIPHSIKNFFKDNIFFIFDYKEKLKVLKIENNLLSQRSNNLEDQINILKKSIENLSYNPVEKKFILAKTSELKIQSASNQEYFIKKFNFYSKAWQYNGKKPSGYLYRKDNFIFTLTGEGKISYFDIKNLDDDFLNSYTVNTNLSEIVTDKNIYNKGKFGFRGIFIENDRIFLSYQKKVKDDCYNISILSSEFNKNYMNFSNFFTYDDCSTKMSNHTGGRMIFYNDESFLFTIGDVQRFIDAQNDDSLFGKIIKINYENAEYKIIAKGMRDTQGGTFYKKDSIVLLTEHGPQGGDEINSLSVNEFNKNINYGWPIATYGEILYNIIEERNFKTHTENGFKEPLHWFRGNSVAPSHIINADGFIENSEGDFFMSAMGNSPAPGRRSLHHLKFDKGYSKLIFSDIVHIGERVRDMIFLNDIKKIIMIVENSPSIAVLSRN